MSFNTAKIINVYYKSDRKPYDANGKPISYFGEDFIGSNEATEIRFYMPNEEDLGAVQCAVDVKRANGDKRYDLLTKVVDGLETYYKLELNDWYSAYVGKVTIAFKAYKGGITIVDGVITSVTAPVYVSDIFHLQIAYAPNSTEEVPPFDPSDVTTFLSALSAKLNVNNGIFVIASSLPSLVGGVYNGQWFLVKNNADGSLGKLYYINGSTAEEVELGLGQLNFSTTGLKTDALATGEMRYNDTTGSLDLGVKNSHTIKLGEILFKRVRNDDVTSLKVGQVVYVSGSVGNSGLLLVKKADNVGDATSSKTFGIVATPMNTTSSKDGYVYIYGLVQGVDLTDGDITADSFVAGDVGKALWLGTSGKITKTLPTADDKHSVFVGYLDSYNGAGSNCSIYVKVQNGYEIGELHDVRISAVANKNILRYNSTRQVWENVADLTTAESDIDSLEGRMTTAEGDIDSLEGRMTTAEGDIDDIEDGTTVVTKALSDQNGDVIDTTYLKIGSASATYIPLSQKGVANGVVPLGSNGKVPSIYLSGEQDDLAEYADLASFPLVGETDILYVALDTNKLYRWSGSAYVVISETLAIGETASTAFAGNRGVALEGVVNTANQIDTGVLVWNSTSGKFESANNFVKTSGGNIGIGTTSPTDTLHVAGNVNIASNKLYNGSSADSAGLWFSSNITNIAGFSGIVFRSSTAGTQSQTERMRITNGGNVGIGTTSPGSKLQIASGEDIRLVATNTNAGTPLKNGGILFTDSVSNQYDKGASIEGFAEYANEGFLVFSTSNAGSRQERLRITQTGNVGIGTTSPGALLDVNSTLTTGTNTIARFRWNNASTGGAIAFTNQAGTELNKIISLGGTGGVDLTFHTYSDANALNERIRILGSNGNVGIGTTSPEYNLHIKGSSNTGIVLENTSNSNKYLMYARNGVSGTEFSIYDLVGNADRFGIDASGNVGIGTTSPTSRLEIQSAGTTASGYTSAGNAGLKIDFGTVSNGIINLVGGAELGLYRSNSSGAYDVGVGFGTNADRILRFDTAGVERMRILADGKVGIGTSSPATLLHLNTATTNYLRLETTATSGNNYTGVEFKNSNRTMVLGLGANSNTDGLANSLYLYDGGGTATRLIINANGLVGINETSPTAQLVVKSGATTRVPLIVDTLASQTANLQEWKLNGANKAIIDIFGSLQTGAISNLNSSNNALIQVLNEGTSITRNVNDANPALIVNLANSSATGNIQVWQKAGTAQLAVNGTGEIINATSSSNGRIAIPTTGVKIERNVADANPTLRVNSDESTATGNIQEWAFDNGNVAYVQPDGDFYNTNGTYGTISDLRVKENIVNARNYVEDLMKLRVVKYSLKDEKATEPTKIGFIAQEVEQVFPKMVQTTSTAEIEDMKSIKTSVLIPMLVKAIQELKLEIEELKKR